MIGALLGHIKDRIQGKAPAGAKRSAQWPGVRKAHLATNPTCSVCGGKNKLEVHHMMPFHLDPSLELNPSNLITLCESKKSGITCHLFFGHLGSYKRFNPRVMDDSKTWQAKLRDAAAVEAQADNHEV